MTKQNEVSCMYYDFEGEQKYFPKFFGASDIKELREEFKRKIGAEQLGRIKSKYYTIFTDYNAKENLNGQELTVINLDDKSVKVVGPFMIVEHEIVDDGVIYHLFDEFDFYEVCEDEPDRIEHIGTFGGVLNV